MDLYMSHLFDAKTLAWLAMIMNSNSSFLIFYFKFGKNCILKENLNYNEVLFKMKLRTLRD